MDKEHKCLVCGEEAKRVRVTQFSGTHYFCLEHAKEEEDFHMSDTSYAFWEELEQDE